MERSRDLVDQAQDDLKHARGDIDGCYYNLAYFSAQQAAEKGLKAVFQKMGAEAMGIFSGRSAFGVV